MELSVLTVLQPRHVVRTPYVHDWPGTGVFVECCHANNDVGLREALGHEVRAADRTEMPELSR